MQSTQFCGKKSSVIALGTMDFGGKIEEGQAQEFLSAYLEIGGNCIDTARIYGDFAHEIQGGSEKVIGRWLAGRHDRDRLILGTKGGHPDPHAMRIGRLSREEIFSDIERSMAALKTEYLDIYWLHRDDVSRPVKDILETLTELVERGMTRHVGVSNWTTKRIAEANACARQSGLVSICANQPQYSLVPQVVVEDPTLCQMDKEMYAYHVSADLPCVPFSSQAKGFLSKMDALGEAGLTDKARRRFLCPENLEILKRAQTLAHSKGVTIGSIGLAYLTNQPFPCVPIAGVSKMAHIEALSEAGAVRLTEEERDFLRTI